MKSLNFFGEKFEILVKSLKNSHKRTCGYSPKQTSEGRELSFCNPRLGRELKKARNYKEAAAMRASSLKVFEPDLLAEDVEDFERDGASRAAALAHPAF